jgi:hypothetical protein
MGRSVLSCIIVCYTAQAGGLVCYHSLRCRPFQAGRGVDPFHHHAGCVWVTVKSCRPFWVIFPLNVSSVYPSTLHQQTLCSSAAAHFDRQTLLDKGQICTIGDLQCPNAQERLSSGPDAFTGARAGGVSHSLASSTTVLSEALHRLALQRPCEAHEIQVVCFSCIQD